MPTNKDQVVEILNEIAVLLELKGENPFKSRAYINAARTIEDLGEPLEKLIAEERLDGIKGIGEGIGKKIKELVATGRLVYYEELKASIGADVVTVRVPNENGELDRAAEALRSIDGMEDVRVVGEDLVVYVRDGKSAIAPIVRAIDERSIPVEEITLARPTLDDVFLQKTGHHLEAQDEPSPTVRSVR